MSAQRTSVIIARDWNLSRLKNQFSRFFCFCFSYLSVISVKSWFLMWYSFSERST